jgi:hypothetical protein
MAGLEADGAQLVSARIGELDDLRIELRVSTDGALRSEKRTSGAPRSVATSSVRSSAHRNTPRKNAVTS